MSQGTALFSCGLMGELSLDLNLPSQTTQQAKEPSNPASAAAGQ